MNALVISFLTIILAPFGAIIFGSPGIGLTESMAVGTVVALAGIAAADYGARASRQKGHRVGGSAQVTAAVLDQPGRVAMPGVVHRRRRSAALGGA
jgi:hypothetical protein